VSTPISPGDESGTMERDLANALEGENEIRISFDKRDGRKRTIPIWFTVCDRTVELLPMYQRKTKWFLDVQKSGELEIRVGGLVRRVSTRIVAETGAIEEIKRSFALKYGESQVRKYYAGQDVAVEADF